MDKRTVATILDEIGTFLELKGENTFKIRAYQNAARLLLSLDEDLDTLVREGRLGGIKGIGDVLAAKITELVTTGRLGYHQMLKAEFPPGFLDLLRIPGFGPKKARAVLTGLGISNIDELEAAAREKRLAALPGFGARTEEKILEGIAHLRKSAERFLVNTAEAEASQILESLAPLPEVEKISVAGSLRRRSETVKDIDIVVATSEPAPVMERFVGLPSVEAVTGHGETKSSVRLQSGIAADLRCVSPAQFPYALMHFTGSKAHNVALRARAQRLGLRLNEYGLFRESPGGGSSEGEGGTTRAGEGGEGPAGASGISCPDEAAVYRALGLACIEPELREDTGEIEAAEAGTLPRLIAEGDIRGLLHQHTNWSDGFTTIEEMAQAGISLGLEYLGITDHSRTAAYAGGLTIERVRQQHAAVDAANSKFRGRIVLLKGIESDILPDGSLDYPEEVLAAFDYVIASVHSQFGLSEAAQTARMVKAMANPYTRILGHPTGRLLLSREPYAVNLRAVLEAAAAHDVAVEISAHPQRLDLDWRECRAAKDLGCRISINPDAHAAVELAYERYGVGIARKGWLTAADVINTMGIGEVRAFLGRQGPADRAGRARERRRRPGPIDDRMGA